MQRKTTLISQLTGLIPTSSGDAKVNGFSITKDMEQVRQNLAFCPQENPLYDSFSLFEHLEFFAELRAASNYPNKNLPKKKNIRRAIRFITQSLGIADRLDVRCQDLSGGQKRRMWVACALFGGTPLILLDEPTSGMDPQARREFWTLLKETCKRQNRACVFTTHSLDEADMLAERKAILAAGRVVCCGTSQQLKKQWGVGYWLNLSVSRRLLRRALAAEAVERVERRRMRALRGTAGTSSARAGKRTDVLDINGSGRKDEIADGEAEILGGKGVAPALVGGHEDGGGQAQPQSSQSVMITTAEGAQQAGEHVPNGIAAEDVFVEGGGEQSEDVYSRTTAKERRTARELLRLVGEEIIGPTLLQSEEDDFAVEDNLSSSSIGDALVGGGGESAAAQSHSRSQQPLFHRLKRSAKGRKVLTTEMVDHTQHDDEHDVDHVPSPRPPQDFFDQLTTKNPKQNDFFLSFAVPWEQQRLIPRILHKLEDNLEEYLLQDLSIEITSMEEVFSAAGESAEKQREQNDPHLAEEAARRRESATADKSFSRAPLRQRQFSVVNQMTALVSHRVNTELFSQKNRYVYTLLMLAVTWVSFALSASGSGAMMRLLLRKNVFGLVFIVPLYLFGGCLSTAHALLKERLLGVKQHLIMHGMRVRSYHLGNFCSYFLPNFLIYALAYLPLVLFVEPFASTPAMKPVLFLLYLFTCCGGVLQAQAMAGFFGSLFQIFFSIFSILLPFSWFCLNTILDLQLESRREWEFILYLRRDKSGDMQALEFFLSLCFPAFALQNAIVYLFRFHYSFEPAVIWPVIWNVWQDDPRLSRNTPEINSFGGEELLQWARSVAKGEYVDPAREKLIRSVLRREHPEINQENFIRASVELGWTDYLVGWPPSYWTDHDLVELGGYNLQQEVPKEVWGAVDHEPWLL